nr:atherin-like [Aegilops tauschii subsp. strangulata]
MAIGYTSLPPRCLFFLLPFLLSLSLSFPSPPPDKGPTTATPTTPRAQEQGPAAAPRGKGRCAQEQGPAAASRRAQGQGPLRPGARAGRREPPPGAKAAASRRAQGQGPPRPGAQAAASRAQEKRQRPARSSACTQPVEPPPSAWPAT